MVGVEEEEPDPVGIVESVGVGEEPAEVGTLGSGDSEGPIAVGKGKSLGS